MCLIDPRNPSLLLVALLMISSVALVAKPVTLTVGGAVTVSSSEVQTIVNTAASGRLTIDADSTPFVFKTLVARDYQGVVRFSCTFSTTALWNLRFNAPSNPAFLTVSPASIASLQVNFDSTTSFLDSSAGGDPPPFSADDGSPINNTATIVVSPGTFGSCTGSTTANTYLCSSCTITLQQDTAQAIGTGPGGSAEEPVTMTGGSVNIYTQVPTAKDLSLDLNDYVASIPLTSDPNRRIKSLIVRFTAQDPKGTRCISLNRSKDWTVQVEPSGLKLWSTDAGKTVRYRFKNQPRRSVVEANVHLLQDSTALPPGELTVQSEAGVDTLRGSFRMAFSVGRCAP